MKWTVGSMVAQALEQKIYVALEDGMKVERYSHAELYEKLSRMNDFNRMNFIKDVNATYGYEVVNYKLLQQMHEQASNEPTVIKQANKETDEFAKDYMKAYMKMLSV